MSRIRPLSPLVINQIAAGEVVLRPASVVKELIENAIDAHATVIEVTVRQSGLSLIEVRDNGDGILVEDLPLALARHATSKMADIDHITGVDTLGFRGEALASIVSVSRLTLTSSTNDSGIGYQVSLAGAVAQEADNLQPKPVICQRGTTVSVRDVFFNVPARRKHLKSFATEFAHVDRVVRQLALQFGDIHFRLISDNQTKLDILPVTDEKTTQARMVSLLGEVVMTSSEQVAFQLEGMSPTLTATDSATQTATVTGFLLPSSMSQSKSTNLTKILFVNRRLVKQRQITQAISQVARQYGGNECGYVLFINLPKCCVNANIHPQKSEVEIAPMVNLLAQIRYHMGERFKRLQQSESQVDQSINHEQKMDTTNSFNQTQSSITLNQTVEPLKDGDAVQPSCQADQSSPILSAIPLNYPNKTSSYVTGKSVETSTTVYQATQAMNINQQQMYELLFLHDNQTALIFVTPAQTTYQQPNRQLWLVDCQSFFIQKRLITKDCQSTNMSLRQQLLEWLNAHTEIETLIQQRYSMAELMILLSNLTDTRVMTELASQPFLSGMQ